MAIPVTALHILRLMLQGETNLSGLQRDIRSNAQFWMAAAVAQSVDVDTLAGWMTSAAQEYSGRLAWVSSMQEDADTWGKVIAMFGALGGSSADFDAITSPLRSKASQIASSDKSGYAAIIVTCQGILDEVPAPLSLWPE